MVKLIDALTHAMATAYRAAWRLKETCKELEEKYHKGIARLGRQHREDSDRLR